MYLHLYTNTVYANETHQQKNLYMDLGMLLHWARAWWWDTSCMNFSVWIQPVPLTLSLAGLLTQVRLPGLGDSWPTPQTAGQILCQNLCDWGCTVTFWQDVSFSLKVSQGDVAKRRHFLKLDRRGALIWYVRHPGSSLCLAASAVKTIGRAGYSARTSSRRQDSTTQHTPAPCYCH